MTLDGCISFTAGVLQHGDVGPGLELRMLRLSPAGSGRAPGGLHHRPWPGLMTVTVTRLWGSCWAPTWPCVGDLQPCSLTWGHGCLFSLGRGPQALGMQCPGRPARGLDTDWAQAWCRAARGAPTCLRCARTPRKWACVPVCVPAWSVAIRPGGPGPQEGRTSLCPQDGAPNMPSWDGKCSIR